VQDAAPEEIHHIGRARFFNAHRQSALQFGKQGVAQNVAK
jgi:hypothetical protein